MENRGKIKLFIILIIVGVMIAIFVGIYTYHKGGISDTNMIDTQRLAKIEENSNEIELNEIIATSSKDMKISPNAIVIEKRYYKGCDHLIRENTDIPVSLINQSEEEIKKYYSDWKVEEYSSNEIIVYKEFEGICHEHYVIKENNGVLGIYIENDEKILEWQEDTEIEVQYLPEEDIEEFKVGVRVVGKTNLYNFLENYE